MHSTNFKSNFTGWTIMHLDLATLLLPGLPQTPGTASRHVRQRVIPFRRRRLPNCLCVSNPYHHHEAPQDQPTTTSERARYRSSSVLCSWMGLGPFARRWKKQHKEQCALVCTNSQKRTNRITILFFPPNIKHTILQIPALFFAVLINSAPCTKMLSVWIQIISSVREESN